MKKEKEKTSRESLTNAGRTDDVDDAVETAGQLLSACASVSIHTHIYILIMK